MAQFRPGIDLVEVRKVARVFRGRTELVAAVFSDREAHDCLQRREPWRHFAEHFAAKEACLKALGLGFQSAAGTQFLHEIELVCGAEQPQMMVHGWLAGLSRKMGIFSWSISVRESCGFAAASVVAVQERDRPTGAPRPVKARGNAVSFGR